MRLLTSFACLLFSGVFAQASSSSVSCSSVHRFVGDAEYRFGCPFKRHERPTKTEFTRNAFPIPNPASSFRSLQLGTLLILQQLTSRHSAVYRCTVKNANGAVIGEACKYLTVSSTKGSPPVVDLSRASSPFAEVPPGHNETIACPVQGARAVWWYKERAALDKPEWPTSRRQWSVTSQRLHFAPFLARDEGNYSCVAVNEFGRSAPAFFYRKQKGSKRRSLSVS